MKQEEMNISQLMAFALAQFIDQGRNVRSVTPSGGCMYNPKVDDSLVNPFSGGCLIGILIDDVSLKTAMDDFGDTFSDMLQNITDGEYIKDGQGDNTIIERLPKILVAHSDIATKFQNLHDTSTFWNYDDTLLNVEGTSYLIELISDYEELDMDDFDDIFDKLPEAIY